MSARPYEQHGEGGGEGEEAWSSWVSIRKSRTTSGIVERVHVIDRVATESDDTEGGTQTFGVRSALAIDLQKVLKRKDPKVLEVPLVSRLLATAELWQSQNDRAEFRNRFSRSAFATR